MAAVAPLTAGTADLSSAPWPSVHLHHILLHKFAAPCSFFILLWWRPNWFAFANKQKRSAKDKHRLSWPHPLIHIRIVMINVSIALYCIAPPPASKNLGTKWFRHTPYCTLLVVVVNVVVLFPKSKNEDKIGDIWNKQNEIQFSGRFRNLY